MSDESKPTPSEPSKPSAAELLLVPVPTHLKRAWSWDVGAVQPDPAEVAAFGSGASEQLLRYVLWRRSTVLLALAAGALALLLALISTIDDLGSISELPNGGGLLGFLSIVVLAAKAFLVFTLVRSFQRWKDVAYTGRLLRRGWLVALLAPLVLSLMPIVAIVVGDIDIADRMRMSAQDMQLRRIGMDVMGMLFGIAMFVMALPALLSLFPGVLRASMIVKTLFPSRSVGPVVGVAITPIYAIFLLVILVPLQQLVSNWIFLIGMVVLAIGPLAYSSAALRLIRPMEPVDAEAGVSRARNRCRAFMVIGVVFILGSLVGKTVLGMDVVGFGDNVLISGWNVLAILPLFITMISTYSVIAADGLVRAMRDAEDRNEALRESSSWKSDSAPLAEIGAVVAPLPFVPGEAEADTGDGTGSDSEA